MLLLLCPISKIGIHFIMFSNKTNMLQNNYEMYVSKISTTLNNILDHLNVKRDLYSVGPLSEAVSQHFFKTQLKVLYYFIMTTYTIHSQ